MVSRNHKTHVRIFKESIFRQELLPRAASTPYETILHEFFPYPSMVCKSINLFEKFRLCFLVGYFLKSLRQQRLEITGCIITLPRIWISLWVAGQTPDISPDILNILPPRKMNPLFFAFPDSPRQFF